jgi:putative Holliday junction resolvase
MSRWIGIDFGAARTGIAHTDAQGLMAFPFKTVPTSELINVLERLVEEADFAGFALGLPNAWGLNLQTGATHSTTLILDFQKQLKKKWPNYPVHLVDETNTSAEAVQASISGGMKKKKRREKGSLDAVAAALILQRFLEQKSSEFKK